MPGLDRTGPQGQGSRTGRQMGRCSPGDKQRDESPEAEYLTGKERLQGWGMGRGRRRGLGRGPGRNHRNWE